MSGSKHTQELTGIYVPRKKLSGLGLEMSVLTPIKLYTKLGLGLRLVLKAGRHKMWEQGDIFT